MTVASIKELVMMEERFFVTFIQCYFIAIGVIIGCTLIGSIGSFATGDGRFCALNRIARSLRSWAVVAAICGTVAAIPRVDNGVAGGSRMDLCKQALFILTAMGGVKTAILLIEWLIQEEIS